MPHPGRIPVTGFRLPAFAGKINRTQPVNRYEMKYEELSKDVESLSYRDKFRLAQLLIQLARKEEEEQNPEKRQATGKKTKLDPELIEYVAERLLKLKPSKQESLFNSIGAMFQFQGGISDTDKEKIFSELKNRKFIRVSENGRVQYPVD